MRGRWGRIRVIGGVLAAILSDLRRRAWWAYRRGGVPVYSPPTTIVARLPAERGTYVPRVTAIWQPLAADALPVQRVALLGREPDDALPLAFIDVTDRPDIADLPRVISGADGQDTTLIGMQWLADRAEHRIILVITVVEPVACTWAVSFDPRRWAETLQHVADTGELFVAWDRTSQPERPGRKPGVPLTRLPSAGLLLPLNQLARVQLRAILNAWVAETAME